MLKGSSSRWLGKGFAWQEGYGAFSVSPSQVATVKRYIAGQEEHHLKRSFEEEFTEMLRKCGLEYDPRLYLVDISGVPTGLVVFGVR